MTELRRLLDENDTDAVEADLLRLARSDGPSLKSRERILAALGAGAVGVAADTATGAGAQTAAKGVGMSSGLKWGLVGLAGLAIPLGAWLFMNRADSSKAPRSSTEPPAVVAPPPEKAVAPAVQAPEAAPIVSVDQLPALPSTDAKPGAAEPSLAEEVAQIKKAKGALAGGSAQAAIHELDVYKTRFPKGRLAQEATMVRIEALLRSGNRQAATALGQRFLKANPDSPYAARVRSLIGE